MVSRPRVSLDKSASGAGMAARADERVQSRSRMGSDRFIGDNCYGWRKMAIQGSKTKFEVVTLKLRDEIHVVTSAGYGVWSIKIGKMSVVTLAATSRSHPYF